MLTVGAAEPGQRRGCIRALALAGRCMQKQAGSLQRLPGRGAGSNREHETHLCTRSCFVPDLTCKVKQRGDRGRGWHCAVVMLVWSRPSDC